MTSPWRPCDEFQSQLRSSNTELPINYGCARVWTCAYTGVNVRARLTHGLRSQNLRESRREGDEHHGVGDPGDVLQEQVAVQSSVHPLLCYTQTDTHLITMQSNTLQILD